MKNIARRILSTIFPPRKTYAATVAYSGLLFDFTIAAPSERCARIELDEIADGGFIVSFAKS